MFGVNWVGGLVLLALLLLLLYVVRRAVRAISGRARREIAQDPGDGDWASRFIERGGERDRAHGSGDDLG